MTSMMMMVRVLTPPTTKTTSTMAAAAVTRLLGARGWGDKHPSIYCYVPKLVCDYE